MCRREPPRREGHKAPALTWRTQLGPAMLGRAMVALNMRLLAPGMRCVWPCMRHARNDTACSMLLAAPRGTVSRLRTLHRACVRVMWRGRAPKRVSAVVSGGNAGADALHCAATASRPKRRAAAAQRRCPRLAAPSPARRRRCSRRAARVAAPSGGRRAVPHALLKAPSGAPTRAAARLTTCPRPRTRACVPGAAKQAAARRQRPLPPCRDLTDLLCPCSALRWTKCWRRSTPSSARAPSCAWATPPASRRAPSGGSGTAWQQGAGPPLLLVERR